MPLSAEAEASPAAGLAVALANALSLGVRVAHVLDAPGGETGLESASRYADAAHHEYREQLAELVRRAVSANTLEEWRCISDVALLRGEASAELLRRCPQDSSAIANALHS